MEVQTLGQAADWARGWLFDAALPLWWEKGANRGKGGGFHDKLDREGRPVDAPQRLRVQARQTFVYAEAGLLGWGGPWREAVAHGIEAVLGPHRRGDGLYRAAVDAGGQTVSDAVDLYDQAFVLLAFASASQALDRTDLVAEAQSLVACLQERLAHPMLGFEEDAPRRLPLRANPHMHLLEAALAWIACGVAEPYTSMARDIVELALTRLIDPATGAIAEFCDGDWRFASDCGHIREPGHQFEWAYLLDAAAPHVEHNIAPAVRRLFDFGVRHGLSDGRAVAELAADGAVIDGGSRLWAQTEWLRTTAILGPRLDPAFEEGAILRCVAALRRFLVADAPGLWIDRLAADGTPVAGPSPASSLYHIVTGLTPLIAPSS